MAQKIILVEDSAMLVNCLRLLLAPAEVVIAHDMATAKALVRSAGPDDTVMIDLKLPDSSPLQTLSQIVVWKNRKPAPRVVVITGTTDRSIIEAANNGPADAVALKSDSGEFFETLRGLGLFRQKHGEECACIENVERIEREVQSLVRT